MWQVVQQQMSWQVIQAQTQPQHNSNMYWDGQVDNVRTAALTTWSTQTLGTALPPPQTPHPPQSHKLTSACDDSGYTTPAT
jgi:hypothetical protein